MKPELEDIIVSFLISIRIVDGLARNEDKHCFTPNELIESVRFAALLTWKANLRR